MNLKLQDFEKIVADYSQNTIVEKMKDNKIDVEFEGELYTCKVESRNLDCEFFIPRVIEPSFGISRVLYALVEQSFQIRDERNVLSIKPKMAYLHCVLGFLKYSDEYELLISELKKGLNENSLRFRTTERSCSIGRKYSSFDEIGVPFFITFDIGTLSDKQVTIRERDTTKQIRVDLKSVADLLTGLVKETISWTDLYEKHGFSN